MTIFSVCYLWSSGYGFYHQADLLRYFPEKGVAKRRGPIILLGHGGQAIRSDTGPPWHGGWRL